MPKIVRPLEKPYLLRKRIAQILDDDFRNKVKEGFNKHFDHNRKNHILSDRALDLTFTEALLITNIIGCTPEQLADNTFNFNQLSS